MGVQIRLAGLQEHTDLGRSRIQGAQLCWQSHKHTKVLQDLSTKACRPQGGHFGDQMTHIAADHPVEPWYQGTGDLSNRHTDHGGSTKIVDLSDASDLHGTFRSPSAQMDLAEQRGTPTPEGL
jgi:hypothetical protein